MEFCNKCSTNRGTLVEVYNPKSIDSDGSKLCQYCVVGKTLPVIRLHTSNWEMAEVKRFEGGRHLVQFFDEETELVVLDEAPFTHYLSHFRVVKDDSDDFEELQDLDPLSVMDAEEDFALAFSFGNNESNPADWILDKNFGRSFDSFASDAGADASSESSSHFNSSVMSDDNKKKLPQLWTPGEDHILVCVVQSQPRPIKWSIVAQFVKDRSGKQCRERYVNHLKPQVKNDVWSPLEDSELFRMFHYHGSKWALMAKLLRGRTDNSIKNRFHHLRRRLEKDVAKKTNAEVVVDQSNFISMTRAMSPFIADMEEESDTTGTFGPFAPSVGLQCKRCALMVPSAQTGRNVCQSTGWCQSCTKMPSYFCDDVLREVLMLARPVVIDEPKLIDVTTAPSSDWTRTTGASMLTLDG